MLVCIRTFIYDLAGQRMGVCVVDAQFVNTVFII